MGMWSACKYHATIQTRYMRLPHDNFHKHTYTNVCHMTIPHITCGCHMMILKLHATVTWWFTLTHTHTHTHTCDCHMMILHITCYWRNEHAWYAVMAFWMTYCARSNCVVRGRGWRYWSWSIEALIVRNFYSVRWRTTRVGNWQTGSWRTGRRNRLPCCWWLCWYCWWLCWCCWWRLRCRCEISTPKAAIPAVLRAMLTGDRFWSAVVRNKAHLWQHNMLNQGTHTQKVVIGKDNEKKKDFFNLLSSTLHSCSCYAYKLI